ncbi:MAG TPA: hypothetical protein DEB56_11175 [Thiobacillus sp.]|nr:hypothetical protein [Thiobacillus sp.]
MIVRDWLSLAIGLALLLAVFVSAIVAEVRRRREYRTITLACPSDAVNFDFGMSVQVDGVKWLVAGVDRKAGRLTLVRSWL